ncbi:MAG TPA: DUF3857 domain-containing protein [Puia sp.]|nr:DUF3857 domain-containing protein [Puia sp.]
MKKQSLCLILGLISIRFTYSQTINIEMEQWEEKPFIHSLNKPYTNESAVIIADKRRYEFIDNSKSEVEEYFTFHRIIHLNDDRGIEMFNKIYLGINENSDVIDVKARAILPGGKIIELNKNNIKDLKEEDGNIYKIFAMEGLEKGCEIEYLYTYKKEPSYFGRDVAQTKIPVLESLYEIVAPQRLQFEIKSYNCAAANVDTVINNKRRFYCELKNIQGAEDEKYASYDANLQRLEFKLSYNNATHKGERLFTWNELAKKIYGVYTSSSEKDLKKIVDIVKSNGWQKLADEILKITAVENYLKKNIAYNEGLNSEEGNKIGTILQNKIAGTIGIMCLYSAVLQNLEIDYQFVLTGDRDKFIIDKGFENWDNCDYPLLYFPAEKKFLAPTRPDFRYPLISPSWGATNGLFCKKTSIGNFSTAIGEVKTVELEDFHKSFSDIESKIEFDKSLDSLTIDAKQIFGGYTAATYRDIFNFSNAEEKQSVIKELAKTVSSSEHIITSEIKNQEFENNNSDLPFIFHSITKSNELIEKAGNKILIKIGLAIGPQTEMYQEKPRQQPVSLEYPHIEERTIDFVIPNDYIIKNIDDLKIAQTFKDNGELTMGFVSTYKINGNILSIHIMEEYCKTFYPLSQFEDFKKIINASSDFNKVVLVLEKK